MSQIAQAILDTIRPNKYLGIEHQGNWPVDAEFAILASRDGTLHRYYNFYSSKEELDIALAGGWEEGYEKEFMNRLDIWGWDLGPELIKTVFVNRPKAIQPLAPLVMVEMPWPFPPVMKLVAELSQKKPFDQAFEEVVNATNSKCGYPRDCAGCDPEFNCDFHYGHESS